MSQDKGKAWRRRKSRNPRSGSSFESFLEEAGIRDEVYDYAIKAVIAWQLIEAMRAQKISKKKMAERLHTSRTQINRLLDPENDAVSLATLDRAARLVGKRIRLELVDAA